MKNLSKIDKKELVNQFDLRGGDFDKSARWIKDKTLLKLHRNLIRINNNSRILECCCGTGIVGSQFTGKTCSVTGIDINETMLNKARKRLDKCLVASAESIPFNDNYFDAVICRQALHFLNMKKAINEMFRVCKCGGQILISQIVPYGKSDRNWLCKMHREKQPLLKNFPEEQEIMTLIGSAGFKKIEKKHYYIFESINDWLKYAPELTIKKIKRVKDLSINAPGAYKRTHQLKFIDNDILDRMKWVLIKGVK